MKKLSLFIPLFFFALVSFSQTVNIKHATLDDFSLTEPGLKEIVSRQQLSYADVLDAALLIGGYSNEIERRLLKKNVTSFIDSELEPVYNPKKLEKSLIKIEARLRAQYTKVYVQNALVKDAITVGEYNCVQFATLFAFTLDRLGIPFYMKADGRCYYLFAGANEKMFAVDEMQPLDVSTNPAYHEAFAQQLLNMKIISEVDLITQNHSELFQKYNDEASKMTPKMLLASQFVLQSSLESIKGAYESSFEYAKSADFLLPSISTLAFTLGQGYEALDNDDFKSVKSLNLITQLYRYNKSIFEIDFFTHAVVNLNENLTTNQYKTAIKLLQNSRLDDSAMAKINLAYHDLESAQCYGDAQFDSGYHHAKLAYQYSSRDEDYSLTFCNRFSLAYQNKSTDQTQLELNRLNQLFPELRQNQFFQMIRLNIVLINASDFIANKNIKAGLELLAKFESEYKNINSDLQPDEIIVLSSYGALATYYYSKNNIGQAKINIDKALAFYPYNNLLLFKKRAIYGN